VALVDVIYVVLIQVGVVVPKLGGAAAAWKASGGTDDQLGWTAAVLGWLGSRWSGCAPARRAEARHQG
jgi:hypothetical protein